MILVVDDDEEVRAFIRVSLETAGYNVDEAADGSTALALLSEMEPTVIVLDLMLGQPDGLEVCRRIRQNSNVPIIMLTSRADEIDQAMCLAAGADDYITKPVSSRIISLRVAAQLRRASFKPRSNDEGVASTVASTRLVWESIEMDLASREVRVHAALVPLTSTEFQLLHLLMTHPKQVFTRDQIAPMLGASQNFGLDSAIDTHVSRLRMKIRKAGGPEVVIAVRGVGYRLSVPK